MAVRWGRHHRVDAGLMFPEAELLGVDIVVPEFLPDRDASTFAPSSHARTRIISARALVS